MVEILDKKGLTETEFLRQYDPDKYPKPALTADIAVFRKNGEQPEILLIKRGGHPFLGRWALPGGFAEQNEPLENTAARELMEETGVTNTFMTLVGVYSSPGRDPRGWTVSAAYTAILPDGESAVAGDDASALRWFPLERNNKGNWILKGPDFLAFDHNRIVADAIRVMFG